MFANVYFRVGKGAYISGKEQLSDVITKDSNKPFDGVSTLKPVDAVKTVVTQKAADQPDLRVTACVNKGFPSEYAISGWFKAASPISKGWMSVMRLAPYEPKDLEDYAKLGDRTLQVLLGGQDNKYFFFTYRQIGNDGRGQPSIYKPRSRERKGYKN